MMRILTFFILIFICSSCWPVSVSFKDVQFPEEWEEFYVITFENTAANTPLSYAVLLSEDVKTGLQNNTRLMLSNGEEYAQLVIEGTISNFSIQPVALQEGDEAASNRVTVSVDFIVTEKVPEEKTKEFRISRFVDYSSDQDYASIENELLTEINEQIVQDVINKLSSNW